MRAADRLPTVSFAPPAADRNRAKARAQGDIPGYDLLLLYLDEVCTTPLNPRTATIGDEVELTTLGNSLKENQLQPCVAVDAAPYLEIWPEHAAHVGTAKHVLINGERRFRSARHIHMEKLAFTVQNHLVAVHGGDVAAARARLLKAVLTENVDRVDFDPIEEALGVAHLVRLFGDQIKAGQEMGRDKTWVSGRLTLLGLPADIQELVSTRQINVNDARWLGARVKEDPGITSADLLSLLEKRRAARADARRTSALAEQGNAGPELTAVNSAATPAPPAGEAGRAPSPVGHQPTAPRPAEPAPAPSELTAVNSGPDHPADPLPAPVVSQRQPEGPSDPELTAVNSGSAAADVDWASPQSIATEALRRLGKDDIVELAHILADAVRAQRAPTS